jgi:hypothetical protein
MSTFLWIETCGVPTESASPRNKCNSGRFASHNNEKGVGPFLHQHKGSNAGGALLSTRPSDHVAIDQYAEKALGNRDLLSQQAIRRRLAGASVGAISLESAFGRLHPQLHKLALIPHGIQSGD